MVGTTTARKSSQIAGPTPCQRARDVRRIFRVLLMPRMPTTLLMTGHVHMIVSGQPRGPEYGVANQPTATSMIRNDVTSGQYRGFQRESLLLSLLALRGPNELSAARNCAALSSESSSCGPQD